MTTTLGIVSTVVAVLSISLSALVAWLTLLRRGSLRMTRPTIIAFLFEGTPQVAKIYMRTLLYCTASRGRVIESLFVVARNGAGTQDFGFWAYGESQLVRGSGLYVGLTGVALNHHFLVPDEARQFRFSPGEYILDVYASVVGVTAPQLLQSVRVSLLKEQADAVNDSQAAVFFNWDPGRASYAVHIDARPVPGVL